MHRALARPRTIVAVAAAGILAVACVISTTTRPSTLDASGATPRVVVTPVKAHLLDGSVVVFPTGATVGGGTVTGLGYLFDVTRADSQPTASVPLDSVLGIEVYERRVNPGRTLIYGTATLAASVVGAAGLAVAIFGSCPTVYADSAGVPTLQAESFSYSIAPLLAKRDVDRMSVTPDSAGVIRLSVQNEALETHHIDQMEVVELRHEAGELALPTPRGGPIAVSGLARPASIRDGAGRDVGGVLAEADGAAFTTAAALLDRAIAGGPTRDHLDITVARPAGRDSVAVVLRARNSLLASATLYDYMLARPGASSLDWMGRDLARIGTVAQLANWYVGNFGMRVEVRDGDRWRHVVRLMDFGPTAWRDVGVVVPAGRGDSVRIRLSFTADEFQIDRVALAWGVRALAQRTVAAARVTGSDGRRRDDVLRMLARADEREVVTNPGDQFVAEFDVGLAPPGTRTFMLAAHGYYVEWVRGSWIQAAADSVPFAPSRTPIRDVLRSWRASKDTLEQRFFQLRVPVA